MLYVKLQSAYKIMQSFAGSYRVGTRVLDLGGLAMHVGAASTRVRHVNVDVTRQAHACKQWTCMSTQWEHVAGAGVTGSRVTHRDVNVSGTRTHTRAAQWTHTC